MVPSKSLKMARGFEAGKTGKPEEVIFALLSLIGPPPCLQDPFLPPNSGNGLKIFNQLARSAQQKSP